jgi:hypothetical protein
VERAVLGPWRVWGWGLRGRERGLWLGCGNDIFIIGSGWE